MNKKFIIALSFSAFACSAQSASLFDIPLAKKCYSISKRLISLKKLQTARQCKERLDTASIYVEMAALEISTDSPYAVLIIDDSILELKRTQIYNCVNEAAIAEEQQNLLTIKEQLNR